MARAPLSEAAIEAAMVRLKNADARFNLVIDYNEIGAIVSAGAEGPLQGLTCGVKGNVAVAGLPHSAGSAARRRALASRESDIVSQLTGAGAVVLASLNMHEGALGATTDNAAFGRCINPWRQGFTPGGSSGGSAAALAAGVVDVAIGSDTMGSIRIPAAYCGLFGYKPAGRWLSQAGVTPLSPQLDQIGPMTRDAATLAAVIAALDGPRALSLAGRKLGVVRDYRIWPETMMPVWQDALDRLAAAGADLVDVALGLPVDPGQLVRAGLLVCEADGAREWAVELADPDSGLSPAFRALLDYGAALTPDRLARAQAVLAQTRRGVRDLFTAGALDGLVMPTTPQTAFAHDSPAPLQADWTVLANVADIAAVSCPAGLHDGLPVGIQLMAMPENEGLLLGFASAFDPLPCPSF